MNDLEKNQFMREYWLNSLTDTQIDAFETEWFSNDADAELLEIVRGDLINDYLTNSLPPSALNNFENHFLLNNAEEIAIAQSYLELSRKARNESRRPSIWKTIAETLSSFKRIPQIAFAVLLIGAFVLLIRFYNSKPADIAQNEAPEFNVPKISQNAPSPVPEKTIITESVENKVNKKTEIKNENRQADENNFKKPIEKPIKPPVLFLTNFRGAVKTLKLSSASKEFRLKLDMPGLEKIYKTYEIRIYDAEHKIIVRQKLSGNLSSIKSGEKIEIRLEKGKFKGNQIYKPSLVGYDEENNVEELSSYDSFRID